MARQEDEDEEEAGVTSSRLEDLEVVEDAAEL